MQVILRAYMQQPMQGKSMPVSCFVGFYRVPENTRWEPVHSELANETSQSDLANGTSQSDLSNGTSQSELANGIGHSKQANGTSPSNVIKTYQVMYNELTDADQAILLTGM